MNITMQLIITLLSLQFHPPLAIAVLARRHLDMNSTSSKTRDYNVQEALLHCLHSIHSHMDSISWRGKGMFWRQKYSVHGIFALK